MAKKKMFPAKVLVTQESDNGADWLQVHDKNIEAESGALVATYALESVQRLEITKTLRPVKEVE